MIITRTLMAVGFAAVIWAAVQAAGPQGPPPAGQQAGPPPGQGRGGQRGPNFPQQQRPPGDPAVVARGRGLYRVHCTACHGADLRGGDQGGPNLLRSEVILTDEKGENILPIVRDGRRGAIGEMRTIPLPEDDILAIAEYIHSVMAQAGRQGRPPERETPFELNVLVGDAAAGRTFFEGACSRCHSATGDLQGIATRVGDPRALQNLWVSGGTSGGGAPGQGQGPSAGSGQGGRSDGDGRAVRVTLTARGSAPVTGRLVRIDDFVVSLVQDDGVRRTFRREGAVPKVEISDPLEPHRRLVLELSDSNMHNVTAYLATLK